MTAPPIAPDDEMYRPEVQAILDRANRSLHGAVNPTALPKIVSAFCAELDPDDIAARDRLSEIAYGVGMDPAVVQKALVDGKRRKRKSKNAPDIIATPWQWRDPASIPRRQWLYGSHYIRKYLSCTFAPGGIGKSSLTTVEALTMMTGRALLGIVPNETVNVWIWNGEDPQDETDRRIAAAMQHYGIPSGEVNGRLFCDSGRTTPITIATQTRTGTTIHASAVTAIVDQINRHDIGVMIIDPFVSSHAVTENDNGAINAVAKQWAHIADVTGCAIELVHHTRKTNGAEATTEDGRGAGALLAAARAARVLNRMSKDDAEKTGVDVTAMWSYFRVDTGKSNMAPPASAADWYHMVSVEIANGDKVGVATSWTCPQPFDGVTVMHLRAAQKAVAEGGPWRRDSRATAWVGKPIAAVLGLDPADKAARTRINTMLNTWIANGMFRVVIRKGEDRHEFEFVEVGKWAD